MRRTAGGGIRVPARVARAGVQEYVMPNGQVLREYRPADEVFHVDALDSLRAAPVIELHEPKGIWPDNWSQKAVGFASDQDPKRETLDGQEWVASDLIINRADMIRKIDDRKLSECSLGYSCDRKYESGISPDGEPYDVVQTNIRINHVGIGPEGFARAGRQAKLTLDGNQTIESEEPPMSQPKTKITLDGVEYEHGSDSHISALMKAMGDRETRIASLEERIAKLEAANGELTVKLDGTTKDLNEAKSQTDEVQIQAKVAERLSLEKQAGKVLGDEFKCDGLSDREIKLAAVAKVMPDHKVADDASDSLIEGLYQGALATGAKTWKADGKDVQTPASNERKTLAQIAADRGRAAYDKSLKQTEMN